MITVELRGLISGIIIIINASIQLCQAVDDVSGLPPSFRDVANRLPAIQHTLEEALRRLVEEEDNTCTISAERYVGLYRMLESCRNKATAIQNILQSVSPDANTSLIKRCAMAMKAISLANRVEGLMQNILHDLQVLAADNAVHRNSKSQIKCPYAVLFRAGGIR
ncbi:uncharacterized protein TrAtP1_007302 [Trichoderma atroviride]|uniref:uncharacterized protein n=1 Tax=Hypocrea atroviridis TaxID=63577 RepID=UPI003324F45C|nr:hypothetical protein TrAtP1_007302 [Trichoderma atroviride]